MFVSSMLVRTCLQTSIYGHHMHGNLLLYWQKMRPGDTSAGIRSCGLCIMIYLDFPICTTLATTYPRDLPRDRGLLARDKMDECVITKCRDRRAEKWVGVGK